jgi:hypothetical protein
MAREGREMKHTQGPWEVLDGAILSKDLNAYGNWIIATCNRERTAEDKVNLRLIAAAPEMLEALKFARTELRAAYEFMAERGLMSEVVATGRKATIDKMVNLINSIEGIEAKS